MIGECIGLLHAAPGQEYWLKKGASTVEHCYESTRCSMCMVGLFHNQNHNGEIIARNWLCFSPSNGYVYCFTWEASEN